MEPVTIDKSLQAFLTDGGVDRRTVLIEVAGTKVRPSGMSVKTTKSGTGLNPIRSRTLKTVPESGKTAQRDVRLERIRALLDSLNLPEPPVCLESTRTVVADLTPEELRRVLKLKGIMAVRSNRKHTVSRPAQSG